MGTCREGAGVAGAARAPFGTTTGVPCEGPCAGEARGRRHAVGEEGGWYSWWAFAEGEEGGRRRGRGAGGAEGAGGAGGWQAFAEGQEGQRGRRVAGVPFGTTAHVPSRKTHMHSATVWEALRIESRSWEVPMDGGMPSGGKGRGAFLMGTCRKGRSVAGARASATFGLTEDVPIGSLPARHPKCRLPMLQCVSHKPQ